MREKREIGLCVSDHTCHPPKKEMMEKGEEQKDEIKTK